MSVKKYKTDDGKYAVAYDNEQYYIFTSVNKVVCHIYEDPELKKKTFHRSQLKHISRLTLIT